MLLTADRKGNITKENTFQDRFLNKMYSHMIGRMMIKVIILPVVSKTCGILLDSKISRFLVPMFIRNHAVKMEDYEKKKYHSFNDFFTRKLLPESRIIEYQTNIFISPCDSRLSVYPISKKSIFEVKHTKYSAESLLRNRKLAKKYSGGYIWIFRLCVDDYHRYIYTDNGKVSDSVKLSGVFHTVNPIANDNFPIYKENTREYCLIRTDNFKTVLQMEVGALLVGKIENNTVTGRVTKGQEKGHFAYGGSTVIMMTQKGAVCPDKDLLRNTVRGIETKVKMGEQIGIKV